MFKIEFQKSKFLLIKCILICEFQIAAPIIKLTLTSLLARRLSYILWCLHVKNSNQSSPLECKSQKWKDNIDKDILIKIIYIYIFKLLWFFAWHEAFSCKYLKFEVSDLNSFEDGLSDWRTDKWQRRIRFRFFFVRKP